MIGATWPSSFVVPSTPRRRSVAVVVDRRSDVPVGIDRRPCHRRIAREIELTVGRHRDVRAGRCGRRSSQRKLVTVGVRVVAEQVQHARAVVLDHRERIVRRDRSVGDGRHRADDLCCGTRRAVARLVGEANSAVVVARRARSGWCRRVDRHRAHSRIGGGDRVAVCCDLDRQSGRDCLPFDRGDRELVAVGVRVVADEVQHERTVVLGHRERVVRCDRSVGDRRHRADDLGRRTRRAVARLVGEAHLAVVVDGRLERGSCPPRRPGPCRPRDWWR